MSSIDCGAPRFFHRRMLALFCGLRAGEVLALRWSAVDLERRVLRVRESLEETAGQPLRIKSPKTDAGRRSVALPDVVVNALHDHRRRQLELRLLLGQGRPPADGLLFHALDGGPSRRTGLSIRWAETAAALGIPYITFHALRHSHASMLIAAKVDIATVASRLGHASAATTLRVYAHLFAKDAAAAADAINAAIGGTRPVPKKDGSARKYSSQI